jgi:hypothetical protein
MMMGVAAGKLAKSPPPLGLSLTLSCSPVLAGDLG